MTVQTGDEVFCVMRITPEDEPTVFVVFSTLDKAKDWCEADNNYAHVLSNRIVDVPEHHTERGQ